MGIGSRIKQIARGRSATRIWAPVVVLVLLVSACGGGQAADTTGPRDTSLEEVPEGGVAEAADIVTEATTVPATETTEAESDEDEPETLAEYLGYDFDDPDAAAAQAMENERRVQEMIAGCMAQEGFEYIPAVRPISSSDFAFDQEEFAREQGFGITTWYGEEDPFGPEEDDWEDPNAVIVEALSESEREAYYEVLYGTFDEFATDEFATEGFDSDNGGPAPVDDPYGRGCQGEAFEQVYGAQTEVWQQLGPQLEEMTQRVFADPRFQEANQVWAVCMADRGYPYDGIDRLYEEVFQDFQRRFDEIIGTGGGFVDPFEGWSQEEIDAFLADKSDEEINDFFEQARQQGLEDIDQDALAALQREERELAVAAFECGEELNDSLEDLRQEYESRFIRENQDVLDQLRT